MSLFNGYENTTVAYGQDAKYGCAVANPKGVQQVTWQRLFPDKSRANLATYNKRFGEQVNDPYRGKLIFTEATLSSSSIILANVTWADESCYICSFNVFPEGSTTRQMCLTVRGISSFKTEVHAPSSDPEAKMDEEEVVFSCSATGKPAPTIQWENLPEDVHTHRQPTTTVTNGDNTFTSSSNITLQLPAGWKGHVDCLLNSGTMGQRRETIPFSLPAKKTLEEDGKTRTTSGIAFVITAVLSVSLVIIAVAIKLTRSKTTKERKKRRNDEMPVQTFNRV
ncbi:hypothetical protein PBY51_016889 [Eleginops maclovinus]|uniref:Ig-like domain-containing protein n=2 Tax=Eleginops maclovinus TaxID=56733 RepID=A0AAN7WML2_ELEMC|nr:hypothetical protein PBY51_016889 [Eleginops maclovinus]